jgi:hypothetical protein
MSKPYSFRGPQFSNLDGATRRMLDYNFRAVQVDPLIGSYVSSENTTQTSIVTNTHNIITSITLSVGDWDVSGVVWFRPSNGTTVSLQLSGTTTGSSLNTTFNDLNNAWSHRPWTGGAITVETQNTPTVRYQLTSTATVNLIAYSIFAVSTMRVWGRIWARRVT